MNPQTPRATSDGSAFQRRAEFYLRLTTFLIIVVIALQGYILFRDQTQTILASGTLIYLPPWRGTPFLVPQIFSLYVWRPSMLFGGFQANSTYEFYLMTSTQYTQDTHEPPLVPPQSYLLRNTNPSYTASQQVEISQFLSPGSYYIWFVSRGANLTAVTINISFMLTRA